MLFNVMHATGLPEKILEKGKWNIPNLFLVFCIKLQRQKHRKPNVKSFEYKVYASLMDPEL